MTAQINIRDAELIADYRLRVVFDDGKEQTVDFLPFLARSHHPDIRVFPDKQRFGQFCVEHGDLVWGDYDLCFPIIDLYHNRILHLPEQDSAA